MKENVTVVFSKNRGMQLNLCLETIFRNCDDIAKKTDIYVLYKADEEYIPGYDILKNRYKQVIFVEEKDFKQDLLDIVSSKKHVLFFVDDNVVTGKFLFSDIEKGLENNPDVLGVSLRLGKNTTNCFSYNKEQNVPNMEKSGYFMKFNWQKAELDFNYPIELSSSVFRVEDIIDILENCSYNSPNFLEQAMSESYIKDKPYLLCYEKSVSFCFPINRVQDSHPNRSANVDIADLNKIFLDGWHIRAENFYEHISTGAHELPEGIFEMVRDEF